MAVHHMYIQFDVEQYVDTFDCWRVCNKYWLM